MEKSTGTTIPWTDDEKIRVNGHLLSYRVADGRIEVQFGGGETEMVQSLVARGIRVELPIIMRK